MSIDSERGLWNCFGCDRGGDAITFLQEAEQCDFWEAVKRLASEAGLPVERETTAGEWQAVRSVEAVRLATVKFYESRLSDEHLDELRRDRGFLPKTVRAFRIGYAEVGLRRHLVEGKGFSIDDCVAAGVLTRSEGGATYEVLEDRYVYPNVLNGRVIHLSGRRRGDDGPKWLHVGGRIEAPFNIARRRRSDRVVVVEGPCDCIAMEQLGFPAVALYGTSNGNLVLGHLDHVERVFILMDSDDAGRKASDTLGLGLGLKGRIVALAEDQDPSDFLAQGGSTEEFQRLLDTSKTWFEMVAQRVSSAPTADRGPGLRQLARAAQGADAVELPLMMDIVCGEERLLNKSEFLGLIAEEADSARRSALDNAETEKASMPEEERIEAMALLEDERLLDRVLDDLDSLGCVGEEENKITLFLAMTSRLLGDPISANVKGESSGGKSYEVRAVAELLPPEEVLELTGLSAKALYHMKREIAHKVIIICERPGAEDSDYPLRVLQSEQRLVYMVSVKNPETNEWETKEVELEGPVSLIETTTEARIHEENETRCFDIFVDESREQTERIAERQRAAHVSVPLDRDAIVHPWRNAQRLLERLPVRIPFAPHIDFPTDRLRARRDQVRFLSLIEASALLHQRQRERTVIGGQEYVLASLMDYEVARGLAGKLLQQTVRGYTPKCEAMMRACWELGRDGFKSCDAPTLTRAEIVELTGWSKGTVDRYTQEAEGVGLIEIDRGKGVSNLYRLRRVPSNETIKLASSEEIHRRWAMGTCPDLPKTPLGRLSTCEQES